MKSPPTTKFSRRYRRIVAAIVTIIIFCVAIGNSSRKLSSASSAAFDYRSNSTWTEPTWEYVPDAKPYLGNLSCVFEVAHWDLERHQTRRPRRDIETMRRCGRLRYRPARDWTSPDPNVVFEKLPDGATIYIMGDSLAQQQAVDLLCRLASASRMVRHRIERAPTPKGIWCPDGNETDLERCDVDYRGPEPGPYASLLDLSATFRTVAGGGGNESKSVHVVSGSGNMGVYAPRKNRPRFVSAMGKMKSGDVAVVNQGLHYRDQRGLANDIAAVEAALTSAMDRGVHVLWRETTAGHFHTPDGYYSPLKIGASGSHSTCVPDFLVNRTLSWERYNSEVTPLMRSLGVPVMEAWEATFLLPEYCHVGGGKDCAHFLMPGGMSYLTESLLKYIEEHV
ncbi:hypothetical protein ACHAWF_008381 [Thalassiosira exigua]